MERLMKRVNHTSSHLGGFSSGASLGGEVSRYRDKQNIYTQGEPAETRHLSGKRGGLNGSTQHSARTHLALKTRAEIAREVRSVGTLPWLGFDRVQPNRSVLQGKYCRIN